MLNLYMIIWYLVKSLFYLRYHYYAIFINVANEKYFSVKEFECKSIEKRLIAKVTKAEIILKLKSLTQKNLGFNFTNKKPDK